MCWSLLSLHLAVIVDEHPKLLKSLFTNVTQKPDQSGLQWFCELYLTSVTNRPMHSIIRPNYLRRAFQKILSSSHLFIT